MSIPQRLAGRFRDARRGDLTASILLLAPVAVYGVTMVLSVSGEGMITFGRLDLAVLALVLLYAAAVTIMLTTCSRRTVLHLLITTYCILATSALCELWLRHRYPPIPSGLPWVPMHQVATAGDAMPGITGTIEFTVNSLGLRGREVRLSDVDRRVLCVGGSTTECLYVTDQRSWPWVLEKKLSQRMHKNVFVGNAGKSGLFTLHHDYLLNNYALAKRFEWVVVLCGINDMRVLLNRESYERRRWTIADETLTRVFENKALYRRLSLVGRSEALTRVAGTETVAQDPHGNWIAFVRRRRQEMLRRRTIRELPLDFDAALLTYSANLRHILQTCVERGQRLVLMTQPTLYKKDLPEDLDRLLTEYRIEGAHSAEILQKMMDAFNQVLIDFCQQNGVDYIDLAALVSKDTSTFYDDAHFNISGCEKVATIVADFLAEKLTGGAGQ